MYFAFLQNSCRLTLAIAALLAATAVSNAQGGSSCRFPGAANDVVDRSYSVATGDLDGDLDLAVANFDSHSVSLLMNNGDGTFATDVLYGLGGSPWSMAIGDLDDDLDLDLAFQVDERARERVSVEVVFDWETVGNPGNAADQLYTSNNPNNLRFGAVNYTYRISKHEVTNVQYAEFLNKVAASDPNGLFNSNMDITRSGSNGSYTYSVNPTFELNPVNYVSFFDAMRFTNWLHNGQGSSGTESGVYTISDGLTETRAVGARYFIPSEDEWYKAAYYDPRLENEGGPPGDDNYWLYATQHDNAPIAELPPGGANSANYDRIVEGTMDVGAYVDTTGFYGTFDQAGNLGEWNEAVISSVLRGGRGGSWGARHPEYLRASNRGSDFPYIESAFAGFRVASAIAEPVCASDGTLLEGVGQINDFSATCGSDDLYWAAHGEVFAFQASDPVVQFELTATAPAGFDGGTISVDIEASKQNGNGNLHIRAHLFNFTIGQYVALPGIMGLTTTDAIQTYDLPVGADPAGFIEPGTDEVRLLIQTIQTSGLANVRTQLDEVLFNFE